MLYLFHVMYYQVIVTVHQLFVEVMRESICHGFRNRAFLTSLPKVKESLL